MTKPNADEQALVEKIKTAIDYSYSGGGMFATIFHGHSSLKTAANEVFALVRAQGTNTTHSDILRVESKLNQLKPEDLESDRAICHALEDGLKIHRPASIFYP